MKTAVEWLEIQLFKKQGKFNKSDIEQAKAMEKEQIIKAYNISWALRDKPYATAEKYYNKTFKSENIVMFMTPENGEIESIIFTDNPDCGVKGITFKSE